MRRAWSGDLDAGFILVLQIAAGALLAFFVLVGATLIYDAWDESQPGPAISANALNLILTLTGGLLSLLSTIIGRYFGKRRMP